MSYMTEKRAKELFEEYMKAELLSDPDRKEAMALELELNKGGWFVTSSPSGLTVKRKENGLNFSSLDDYTPSESRIQPYEGGTQSSYKPVWITVGIIVGILAITAIVVYIVKQQKKNIKNVRVA